jgi:hypothetical protein
MNTATNLNKYIIAKGLALSLVRNDDGSWGVLDNDETAFSIRDCSESHAVEVASAFISGTQWRDLPARLVASLTHRQAEILRFATLVWGDRKSAQIFLQSSHALLGGRTPLDTAADDDGVERVEEILHTILRSRAT